MSGFSRGFCPPTCSSQPFRQVRIIHSCSSSSNSNECKRYYSIDFEHFLTGISNEFALIIIDNTRIGIVDSITYVITIMRNRLRWFDVFQLGSSSWFQTMKSFSIESSIISITIFPIFSIIS